MDPNEMTKFMRLVSRALKDFGSIEKLEESLGCTITYDSHGDINDLKFTHKSSESMFYLKYKV